LDSVADVHLGRQRAPKNHSGSNMRPYLRAANVTWTGLRLDDVKTMNFTDSEMAVYRLEPGDVVLGEASGSPNEVGKPAVWRGEIDDCAFQNTLIRVRSNQHVPEYLMHYFRYQAMTGKFAENARGVGIHHLSRAKLAAWMTPIPPILEQRRIVEILEEHLSHLDAAQAGLARTARRLASLEASALSRAVTGAKVGLDSVADIQGGIQKQPKRAPRHNAYPFLRVANVTASGLDLRDVHQIELFNGELERLRLAKGDLLVVEGNGSPSQIGRAATWDGSIPNCVHQNHLIRVRARQGLVPAYLEIVWNSPENRHRLTDLSSSSSGLHTLSVSKLKSLTIPLPGMDEQSAIIDQVARVREQRRTLELEISHATDRAAALRRSLLAAAFSGRLTGAISDLDRAEEEIA